MRRNRWRFECRLLAGLSGRLGAQGRMFYLAESIFIRHPRITCTEGQLTAEQGTFEESLSTRSFIFHSHFPIKEIGKRTNAANSCVFSLSD